MASNKYYVMKNLDVTEEEMRSWSQSKRMLYIRRLRKVIAALKQKKLEQYNKIPGKIHVKQIRFHKSKKRKRLLLGGNRTGKTVGGAVEAVWFARGNHPYKNVNKATDGWVVSLTNEVQRDVAQKEIMKWLDPSWIVNIGVRVGSKSDPQNSILDYIEITSIHGGVSRIGFKTCEQGREKFQGTSKDWIWFDEEPPKDIYDECLMRIMDVRGYIWFTMTPLKGLTFVYDLLYLNPNADPENETITMSWHDNPWLSKAEIAEMENNLTEEELEARRDGKFVALSGLVYKRYNPDIHELPATYDPATRRIWITDDDGNMIACIYKEWYDAISIDPGYTAPTAVGFYARNDEGDIYVIAGYEEKEQLPDHHSNKIKGICKMLEWQKYQNGYRAYIDAAAGQKNAASEKSVKELYSQEGIYCSITPKDVWDGIIRVKKFLHPRPYPLNPQAWPKGRPKLFILRVDNFPYDPHDLRREIKSYRWAEHRDDENAHEKPKKLNDHFLDNLRYYINALPLGVEQTRNLEISRGDGFMSEEEKKDMGVIERRAHSGMSPKRPGRLKK